MTTAKALAAGALLLLSCSPQYESGKTACASSGQACPDGYVCINIRCYKADEAPDGAPAAGGAGGASDARTTSTDGGGGTGGARDAAPPSSDGAFAMCNNPMFPVGCPMSESPNTCWTAGTDCSTVKRCGTADKVYGCLSGFAVDCRYRANNCLPRAEVGGNTRTCSDPMFPNLCPALGDLGPVCIRPGDWDCNARVVCGTENSATVCLKGDTIDCSRPRTERCLRPAVRDGGADSSPADTGTADGPKDSGPG